MDLAAVQQMQVQPLMAAQVLQIKVLLVVLQQVRRVLVHQVVVLVSQEVLTMLKV